MEASEERGRVNIERLYLLTAWAVALLLTGLYVFAIAWEALGHAPLKTNPGPLMLPVAGFLFGHPLLVIARRKNGDHE